MTDETMTALAKENRDLRQVVMRLSAIVLRSSVEQRQLATRQAADALMTPVERIAKLRELSLHSGQLRELSLRLMQIRLACRESEAANVLKGLAGEFVDEAGHVDSLIAAARGDE
jgi:hypothetical protein